MSAPLQKLGLLETIARMDCPSRSHYVFHKNGKILGYYGNSFHNNKNKNNNRGYGQRGNLRVPRQSLRKVMMDALVDRDTDDKGERKGFVHIQWGKKLVTYTTQSSNCNLGDDFCVNGKSSLIISMIFQDGSTETADLLIGADGVRSKVVEKLLSVQKNNETASKTTSKTTPHSCDGSKNVFNSQSESRKDETDLTYIGIMIVLGITSDFFHPLLDERGFYTLDGEHRLFTMPFEGCRISDLEKMNIPLNNDNRGICTSQSPKKTTRRYMWQLSYKLSSLEEAMDLSRRGSKALMEEVLRRTIGWHEPVQDMISSTPLETIWGTPLMDRQPNAIYDKLMKDIYKPGNQKTLRTVVLGDSIHAMSPFKGQGCNQALMDGPLLSSWLEKSTIDAAIKGYLREMTQRTNKKVVASREAADFLHSRNILLNEESFAGVKKDSVAFLLSTLEERNIGAHLGVNLDEKVSQVIEELGCYLDQSISPNGAEGEGHEVQTLALNLARNGNTAGIRNLSLSNPEAIRMAKDRASQETCLHLAARRGCYHTCRWLISEANVNLDCKDKDGHSPLHAAIAGGNPDIISLLSKIISQKHE